MAFSAPPAESQGQGARVERPESLAAGPSEAEQAAILARNIEKAHESNAKLRNARHLETTNRTGNELVGLWKKLLEVIRDDPQPLHAGVVPQCPQVLDVSYVPCAMTSSAALRFNDRVVSLE